MVAHILISLPIVLLGVFLVLRCLRAWGLQLPQLSLPVLPEGLSLSALPASAKVFLFALGLRLAVLLAAAAAVFLRAGDRLSFSDLLSALQQWDARHYVNLVELGYDGYVENGEHLFLVFFPAYVWLTRLVTLLVPNTIVAGTLVSVLCFAGGCVAVYRIGALCWDEQVGWNAVLLLCAFPFSFFSGAVMTEGLFLLTTAWACYFALKRRWLPYAVWGALAALTRMVGLLVIVPALAELLRREKPLARPVGESLQRSAGRILARLPVILAPLLGTAGYLLLNWRVTGDPFAFVKHQAHWYQGGMWISGVLQYLWRYLAANVNGSLGWAIWLPALALFVLSFLVLVLSAPREDMPAGLLAYAFLYLIANYSLSWLLSAGRYLSCGFPLFLLAAALLRRRPRALALCLIAGAVLQGVYLTAWLSGAQVM